MAMDWTAVVNWANYMQKENAFSAATSWATGFVNRWAPLVHKYLNPAHSQRRDGVSVAD